jgi:hypothetical protein
MSLTLNTSLKSNNNIILIFKLNDVHIINLHITVHLDTLTVDLGKTDKKKNAKIIAKQKIKYCII